MAQIKKNETFVDGELVTGLRLNNIIDLAELNPNAITDQPTITTGSLADLILVYQDSTSALKKISISDLMSISFGVITATQVFGTTNLSIASGSGNVNVGGYTDTNIGNSSATSGNVNIFSYNNVSIGGTSGVSSVSIIAPTDISSKLSLSATSAVKLPVGTTTQRPASPVAGDIRFNSTTSKNESYNGTAWNDLSTYTLNTGNYGLYEVFEETIPFASYATTLFTSSSFTKPSNEIWHFEIEGTIAKTSTVGQLQINFVNTSGTAYSQWVMYLGNINNDNSFKSSWIVNSGTALSVETVRITQATANNWIAQSGVNKFRIFKYKTVIA